MMDKTTMEVLELFGELDGVLECISDAIKNGETGDTFDRAVYREDFDSDDIDEEMEKYFGGKEEFEINVSWSLAID